MCVERLIDNNNNNNKLNVIDKHYLKNEDKEGFGGINTNTTTTTLYPVKDILSTEFKGIQVLHYIEEEMKLYNFFKSLLLKEIF